MKAARLLFGETLQSIGDKVGVRRAHLSAIERAGHLASKKLRKRLCTVYGVTNYATLTREIETAKLGRALLANLEPKKD
jgi:transcriptional regulator with XRE-family HTH domain